MLGIVKRLMHFVNLALYVNLINICVKHNQLCIQFLLSLWTLMSTELVNRRLPVPEDYRYYLNFVNVATSYNWICLLKWKSEVIDCFIKFHTLVEKQVDRSIQAIQSDNAKEFLKLKSFLSGARIVHSLSSPHAHPQMGKVECQHQHITITAQPCWLTSKFVGLLIHGCGACVQPETYNGTWWNISTCVIV